LVLLISVCVLCANYKDFDAYQETVSYQEVFEKINRYVKHDHNIEPYYTLTHAGLYIFASHDDKQHNKPEFVLRFGTRVKPKSFVFKRGDDRSKPLHGLRVAIDPGHLGGDMARVEERFIDMIHPVKKTRIQFAEGDLTLWTAQILRSYLVKVGATVFVTREKRGQPVCRQSFAEWCVQEFGVTQEDDWLSSSVQEKLLRYVATLSPGRQKEFTERLESAEKQSSQLNIQYIKQALFRLGYNVRDLQARAQKINAFNPHITIVMHYNANGQSSDVSSDDYNLTFIPGSFLKGELASQSARYEFVRMLVTDDIDESLYLSQSVVKRMETLLHVPTMKSPSYLKDNVLFVQPGIYCRNLILTRLIHGPLCYGETLIQNNLKEAELLGTNDFDCEGIMVPSRVADVARAYFEGVCECFGIVV